MTMKDRFGVFILVFLVLSHLWAAQTSGQPAARVTLPPVPKGYFTSVGTSLDIQPVLSEDDAYDAIIGREGGTMIAEGPDLTVYTLTIPPNALVEPIEITMTPLKSMHGLPFARGLAAGVDLAPNGTSFLQPARLSIRPRGALPDAGVTPFAYGGQGENMYLTPYRVEGDRVVVFVDHFSGQGLTFSTAQERAVQLARAPLGVREKLSQKTAEVISELGRKTPSEAENALSDAIEHVEEAYEREVLEPIRRQCAGNCTMGALYVQMTLAAQRQRQLLSMGEAKGKRLDDLTALDAKYVEQCLREQYEQCLRTGDFRGIEMWYIGYHRQLQIISGDSSAALALEGKVNEYIKSCACYEIEFDSSLLMSGKLEGGSFGLLASGPLTNSYAAALKAKAPVAFKVASPIAIAGIGGEREGDPPDISGFSPLEYTRYEMDGAGGAALALFQDNQGAHGFSNGCVFKGIGSKPGVLMVVRVNPGFKNAANRKYPLVSDSDTSEGAQVIRILRRLPQTGLLAPPRLLDPTATVVWIAPRDVVELERDTCKLSSGQASTQDRDATRWLDQWQRWRPQREVSGGDGPVTVSILEGAEWSSLTDADLRWHDSNTERSEFGTIFMEATVIVRHTPIPMPPAPETSVP